MSTLDDPSTEPTDQQPEIKEPTKDARSLKGRVSDLARAGLDRILKR